MKINRSSRRAKESFVGSQESQPGFAIKHSPFMETLQQYGSQEQDTDQMLEDIDMLGHLLRTQPTFANLKNYKAAIRLFMQNAVADTYSVEERRFIDRRGRRRVYMLVAKINDQLEQLTNLVLNKQADTLLLASRLDEIRGLLLDIKS